MLTLLAAAIRFTLCFCVALPAFYLLASLWEGTFHEVVLDRPWFTKLGGYRRDGWLSELWFARFSHHVVHHHLTYRRSYVEQFHSPADEQSLREKLSRRLDAAQFRSVIASRFGASFTWSGARQFVLPLLLVGLAAVWLCPGAVPRAAILIALLLGTLPYFVFSKWVHPYLHLPFDRVSNAPTILRGLLRSRYGVAMRIGHFVHHRHPDTNYNLQLGYDVLRRRWRAPGVADWDDMVALGLVNPSHREAMEGRQFFKHDF